jgi:hypothetical protein
MSEKISFQDRDGKPLSGLFQASHGMITVTSPDGRTKTVEIEDSMLSPETLAKVLLLQLQQEERQDGVYLIATPGVSRPISPSCRSVAALLMQTALGPFYSDKTT